MIDLARGHRKKLSELTTDERFRVNVATEGGSDVVFVAMLLDERGVSVAPSVVVSDEHPASSCASVIVRATGKPHSRSFDVDLRKVPKTAASILWGVAVIDPQHRNVAADIGAGHWSIEAGGRVVARFAFAASDVGSDAAFSLGELYRKGGEWRLRGIGEGFAGGIGTLFSRFSIRSPTPLPTGGAGFGPIMGEAPAGIWLPKGWPGNAIPAVPKDLTRSVGLVVARDAKGETCTGTAFVVSPGGYLITCWHVVEDAVDVAIAFGGKTSLRKLEVVAVDKASDLALCWLADKNGAADWLLPAAADAEPGLGDELGLLGYPLGVSLGTNVTYTQGVVSSLRQRRGAPVLQIDAGSTSGSSGGPVFHRATGVVVGVLSSGLSMDGVNMNINFAVDVRAIWKLGWVERL